MMNIEWHNKNKTKKVKLKLTSGSRSSYVFLNFSLSKKGWKISTQASKPKKCDPSGKPELFKILNNEYLCYTNTLGDRLFELWRKAHLDNHTQKQLEFNLTKLFKWVDLVNEKQPFFKLTKNTNKKVQKHNDL